MAISDDIAREKIKVVKAVFGSKLGKHISSNVLLPILNKLEKSYQSILDEVGNQLRDAIRDYLITSQPSGRTYKIYEYDPTRPYGQRNVLIGEHTASAPGEPPASLTGTLADSMEYMVFPDGSLYVGLLKGWGEYSDAGTEMESAFYSHGNIVIRVNTDVPNIKTPVGTYGRILEDEVRSGWFKEIMTFLKPSIRERIRKDVKRSLESITRSASVRKAVVFKVYFR